MAIRATVRSRRSIRCGVTALRRSAGSSCRTVRLSTSPTSIDGNSRSARASGKSSSSRAARSKRVSSGRRARTRGCLRRTRGTKSRPKRRSRRSPASPNVAEVAPGKRHSIPSIADCRSCHDSARTEILGFNALQLSTDRDPHALHAEPLMPEMVTLRTLVDETLVRPRRTELVTAPPRIHAATAMARTALGYLSTNCGNCHNPESSIASVGLVSQTLGRWGQTFRFVRWLRMRSGARHDRGTQRSLGRAVQSRRVARHQPGPPRRELAGSTRTVATAFFADAADRYGVAGHQGRRSADGVGAIEPGGMGQDRRPLRGELRITFRDTRTRTKSPRTGRASPGLDCAPALRVGCSTSAGTAPRSGRGRCRRPGASRRCCSETGS